MVRREDLALKVSPDVVVQRIQIRREGLPFRSLDVAGKVVLAPGLEDLSSMGGRTILLDLSHSLSNAQ